MAGRRPKPTALKLVEGNPGKRAVNKREPRPTGIPACPVQLDKVAKNEWRRISRSLITMGLLTVVDRSALAAYCSAWSSWMTAEENIQKFGCLIKTAKSGYPMQNPYVGIANTSMDQMRKFLVEFGSDPNLTFTVFAALIWTHPIPLATEGELICFPPLSVSSRLADRPRKYHRKSDRRLESHASCSLAPMHETGFPRVDVHLDLKIRSLPTASSRVGF